MTAMPEPTTVPVREADAFHRFLVVLRQAILLLNAWIERECGLERRK